MFYPCRPVWAEINLDHFEHNIRQIKKLIGDDIYYIAVIKCNAYEIGAIEAAKVCEQNGVQCLAVSFLDEALALRKAGITCPILILTYTQPHRLQNAAENRISQSCYSYETAKAMSDAATKLGVTGKIHIKVETGLNRTGFEPTEANADLIKEISLLPNLKIEGIYSHFSDALNPDRSYTDLQYDRFCKFLKLLDARGVSYGIRHIANSAAVVKMPEFYLDGVRPGAIQFGLSPSANLNTEKLSLKPVLQIKANVAFVKDVEAGSYLGYERTFQTRRKSRIITVPIGFGDGYIRRLQGQAKMIVNNQFAPVVGKISMDQCMVDVTDVKGDVKVGDEVIVMGYGDGIKIDAIDFDGMLSNGISEVYCMVNQRVPHVYIRDGKIAEIKIDDLK